MRCTFATLFADLRDHPPLAAWALTMLGLAARLATMAAAAVRARSPPAAPR